MALPRAVVVGLARVDSEVRVEIRVEVRVICVEVR